MDLSVTLFCTYMDSTIVMVLKDMTTIQDILQVIRARWKDISHQYIALSYEMGGHPSCMIDFDEDLGVLLSYCKTHEIGLINVTVLVKSEVVGKEYGLHEFSGDTIIGMAEYDIEDDLLPSFSSHDVRKLMTCGWDKGISSVGQKFEGGVEEFRDALCKYAIEVGFRFKYLKNDTIRVTAECAFKKTTGCGWFVHGRVQSNNGILYVKKCTSEHTCGAACRTRNNPRMSSDLIAKEIQEQIREKPLTRPVDIVHLFSSQYGITIDYNRAWWAVEKAKRHVFGDQALSFDKLRWYIDAVKQTNPGSHLDLQCDLDTGRFKRLFIAFHASIEGFKHCRPLIFLDGTFLKSRYKGNLLVATAKNANQCLYPLAFAIVDSENDDNWEWFLMKLSEILSHDRRITFISDRNNGLLKSILVVFPNGYHGYCLHHLKCNLRDKLTGMNTKAKDNIIKLFRLCAYAPIEALFIYRIQKLLNEGGDRVAQFLYTIPKENWSNAFFKGQRYGEMCSNVAESFNSWIRDARHLPITNLVDSIRLQIMKLSAKRRDEAREWNGFLCPNIDKCLQETLKIGRSWGVGKSDDLLFEVHSSTSCNVDLLNWSCSCCQWQINMFPCPHAATVIQRAGYSLNEYVDRFFSIESFVDTYIPLISPIPTFEKDRYVDYSTVVIQPPIAKRPPGRPKKKRIPSRGEETRQIKCSRCGHFGHHNRQSCCEATQD